MREKLREIAKKAAGEVAWATGSDLLKPEEQRTEIILEAILKAIELQEETSNG